jgi:hypothetical protein
MNNPISVFVSKSGTGDDAFIDTLRAEFGPDASVWHEGMFRMQATTASYHEAWAHQLDFWPNATVLVVLLTGSERTGDTGIAGLPFGMGEEIYGTIWSGKPVVFCGTTDDGFRRAGQCHAVFKDLHPFVLSYLWDVGRNGLKALVSLCLSFRHLPKRQIPGSLTHGVSYPFTYNVCRPKEGGWALADLTPRLFRPVLEIEYGLHLVLHQPYGRLRESPRRHFRRDLEITDPVSGLIEGTIQLDEPGVGHMRVNWRPPSDTWEGIDEYPWGGQLLHWDFDCD